MIAALMAATAAASARAASETVIYAFTGGSDGANPATALIYASGLLFGTAENGGKGVGVVFSVTPAGIEKTVYAFTGGNDGATPLGALTVLDGIFYGTTFNGGSSFCGGGGCGTAFSLTPAGEEHVLYAFTTEGASEPQAGLTVLGEKLYGTAPFGSAVFSLSTTGTEQEIYGFKNLGDGNDPASSLTDVGGILYGTTIYGGSGRACSNGSSGCGTVYSVTRRGVERVLYSFSGGADGSTPGDAPISVRGILYGTAGGGSSGYGVVYKLTPNGVETVLHAFAGGSDGTYPSSSLTNVHGILYGTTRTGGGTGCGGYGCGTVYAINSAGVEKIVYAFKGGADGSAPERLLDVDGALYGATANGGGTGCGGTGCGTVFKLIP